jgi:hypothetical protein
MATMVRNINFFHYETYRDPEKGLNVASTTDMRPKDKAGGCIKGLPAHIG